MCGIAGFVNWGDKAILDRMTLTQSHRGPDDSGRFMTTTNSGAAVGLGSRRLAILDLSTAGHMPMSTSDGRLTITYNGEIYNYPELKRGLEARGYAFRSGSDVEAVLYWYREEGPACLRRFNGMFAFAIWDREQDTLFLARDHFGIKPLYYMQQQDRLAFASEIKALLEVPGCPRALNYQALHQYLTFLWVPDPLTAFDGILRLPAGHTLTFTGGRASIQEFWDLQFPPADHNYLKSETDLAAELVDRFDEAVQRQMLSDVPIGAFLSAGLDSSSIVSSMCRARKEPPRTYTIAFPAKDRRGEDSIDDPAVAQRTAAAFGCHHTEIVVNPDVAALLPRLIWHMDEPVADPAIITAFLVCRTARESATVLLSGIGGDELFAGYRKHVAWKLAETWRRIPVFVRAAAVEPLVAALPVMRNTVARGPVRLLKKLSRSASLPPDQAFLAQSVYGSEQLKSSLYTTDLAREVASVNAFAQHEAYFKRVRHAHFLNQMLYVDTKAFMASLNLIYNDKMSMASSVEVRVPFLDLSLAQWVATEVPPTLKLQGLVTKYLLRQAMKPVLPPEVFSQKKAGFGAPLDRWLAYDLRPMIDDLLADDVVRRRGLFEPATVRRLINEHRRGRHDWSFQIWALLTLELWQRTFLDSVHPSSETN
jgi:asparagine synthase (glutamine-hydrolysing)